MSQPFAPPSLTAFAPPGRDAVRSWLQQAHPGHGLPQGGADLLADDQVAACWQQRRLAVIAAEWEVEPGAADPAARAAADDLADQLARLELDRVTEQMLHAQLDGYAVAECLWAVDTAPGGRQRIRLADLKVRDRRRFRLEVDGSLYLLGLGGPVAGIAVPPAKFWLARATGAHDDQAVAPGLAAALTWPVWIKRNALRAWLQHLEKFAAPTVAGRYGPEASEADQRTLLDAARAVSTATAITLPRSMELSLIEASRGGGADYAALIQTLDRAIAKIVLSATLTVESAASYAQAHVHAGVRDAIVKADADLVCGSFNRQVATWLTAWNWPGAAPPRLWRRLKQAGAAADRSA